MAEQAPYSLQSSPLTHIMTPLPFKVPTLKQIASSAAAQMFDPDADPVEFVKNLLTHPYIHTIFHKRVI
jgi:hypothetical protein